MFILLMEHFDRKIKFVKIYNGQTELLIELLSVNTEQ